MAPIWSSRLGARDVEWSPPWTGLEPADLKHPFFFGYGSLVNRHTHAFPEASPARVRGWRRVWRETDLRPAAFLSVVPDPDGILDGLIAAVPNGDWAALDAREYAYDRHPVALADLETDAPEVAEVQLYATRPEISRPAGNPDHPILLSYLDVVVQGYLHQFGEDGVTRFFQTTSGWHAPILNDRDAPIYPRAQTLTRTETALVDDWLARLSAVIQHR